MKATRFYTLLAFLLICGAKAFGQEWEYSIEYSDNDTSCFNQYDAVELSNGNIAVGSALFFKSGAGDFYSAQPAIALLSSNGEELARKDFFKPGFCTTSTTPFLFENQGALYALMTYNPDHDSTYFNHFMNNENPPTDAILGLYKLDDDLSIMESYEHNIPIDTFENRGDAAWDLWPNELSGNLFLFSAIIDEGNIVGAYFKTVSHDYFNPRGNDTLFLFRMNFEGEIIEQKGYDWGVSGANHQNNERRAHIVSTETGYIYYFGNLFGGTAHQGVAYYYDKNFNFLKKRFLKHPGEPNQNSFTNICAKRSRRNTTYLVASVEVKNSNTDRNIRLYELDDNGNDSLDIIPNVHFLERGTVEYDIPAYMQSVDFTEDDSFFFAYALNIGFNSTNDSWMMIEHLDLDFDTISTVYYAFEGGRINSWARAVVATHDCGALLVSHSRNMEASHQYWSSVTKFPAEAFEGIDEAHDNGLKVAIAYPNPGKDVLNIRTGLQNAWVEVYDMIGRKIYGQKITESVISINAEGWPSGSYVWKVMAGPSTGSVTEAESGKWIKQ